VIVCTVEIKGRKNSGYACYYTFQKPLSVCVVVRVEQFSSVLPVVVEIVSVFNKWK